MSIAQYKAIAWDHWEEWLPKKTAELKEAGDFESALQVAAVNANRKVLQLMQYQHYQKHEAEEVALRQYILLAPEPVDYENMPLWEQELEDEMAEKEEEFQAMCREIEAKEARWRQEDEEERQELQEKTWRESQQRKAAKAKQTA